MSAPARAASVRSAARTGALAPTRGTSPRRASLRLVQPPPVGAPRTPFVLLVLALLGGGLVALLLLNAAGVANSDRQRSLREDTEALRLREQQLTREVGALDAPDALAEAARRLGMVPSGDPAFLILLPNGDSRVAGVPAPASAPPASESTPTGGGGGR